MTVAFNFPRFKSSICHLVRRSHRGATVALWCISTNYFLKKSPLTLSAVQVATAYFEFVACRLNDTEAYSTVIPEAWSRLAKLKP
jgi:hypothetical protein